MIRLPGGIFKTPQYVFGFEIRIIPENFRMVGT
jgi:hypothetical protein